MSKHQHYWRATGVPHPFVFLNGKFRYDCSVCNKKRFFNYVPINPIVPSAWDVYTRELHNGNAHLVLSPPLTLGKESEFVEGERYRKLVRKEL